MNTNLSAKPNTAFPQRRNGVRHAVHGLGVVTHGRGYFEEDCVEVRFDGQTQDLTIPVTELTSAPERGESPDPATSRHSGWVGGSSYRKGR